MNDDVRLGIGGNHPPDAASVLDAINPRKMVPSPAAMKAVLERHYPDVRERRDDLLDGIKRWLASHTASSVDPIISSSDPDDLAKTVDFLTQLRMFFRKSTGQVAEAKHAVKSPLLEACRVVEEWFEDEMAGKVADAAQPIQRAYTQRLLDNEKEELVRREEEARKAAEMARQLQDEAVAAKGALAKVALDAAARAAEVRAREAQEAARAPLREISRVRGNLGSVGGLTEKVTWRITDKLQLLRAIVAGEESADLVTPDDRVINALVRPRDGRRAIPGIEISTTKEGR